MIEAAALERRLAGLVPIGLSERGTNRLAWTAEAIAAERWFEQQAEALGLRLERDPVRNLWAVPDAPPPWLGVGSHLDSVRDGGRFDGALGVAAAFEIAARSTLPLAVISFTDEEGARFNTPTFGSRALAGRLDADEVLARRDDQGVTLADASGLDRAALERAPEWLPRLRAFVELHIDQSRALETAGAAAGVVSALAARMRVHAELRGVASHAGTTLPADRRDALAAAARLIVAAQELGADGNAGSGMVVTASRLVAEPNAFTTIPSLVELWLDARAPDDAQLARWRERLEQAAAAVTANTGVQVQIEIQSHSPSTVFDERVRAALRDAAGGAAPELVCFAGHDAGILADKLPAGMVLVRNATGISHAAAEQVELVDAAMAADLVLAALGRLA